MERLTYWCDNGHGGGKWFVAIDAEGGEDYGPHIERLAAYEDTGLEPEDLKRAFNEDDVLKLAGQALGITPERLRELVQADKEGRCVVFQPGYAVVSIYNPADEDGLYTMKVAGVITKEEYEAALRREQDG